MFYAVSNFIYKKVYAYSFWPPSVVYREKERIIKVCPINSGGQVVVAKTFCIVVPNVYEPSVWNVLYSPSGG
jgi:hypothetical protein